MKASGPHKEKALEKFSRITLYPVITSGFCAGRDPVFAAESVLKGGAGIVQLREKHMTKKEIFFLAVKFREITEKYGALLIINDHIDIALAVKADGVHLGQDDIPVDAAAGAAPGLIKGVSTHNLKQALEAQEKGADYINIGPVYATNTKETGIAPLGIEKMREISEKIKIPFTVMGGIKKKHLPELKKAGAVKTAMVTEITEANDITGKVKELLESASAAGF